MVGWGTALFCLSLALGARAQNATSLCSATDNIYSFSLLHNNETDRIQFADFAGKAIVVVNTASFCKYTWHLPLYNALQQDYGNQIAVVAIPCNQFLLQEPGTNPEIPNTYRYVRPGGNFMFTFELAAKLDVNGENEDPLYTYLKNACPAPKELLGNTEDFYFSPIRVNDITWNFEKFLINTNGAPYKRYEPDVHPDVLRSDIDDLIGPRTKKAKSKKGNIFLQKGKTRRQSHLPSKH